MTDLVSLLNKLINMHNVVGYHLPIHPTNYAVDISRDGADNRITMVSTFDVAPKDGCCIPMCCLVPLCRRRKRVTDHFTLDEEESTLELRSTSAFCGLINCCEKGKVFQVIKSVSPYVIMVYPKEIFVLSPSQGTPTKDEQTAIKNAVTLLDPTFGNLSIEYI